MLGPKRSFHASVLIWSTAWSTTYTTSTLAVSMAITPSEPSFVSQKITIYLIVYMWGMYSVHI